MRDEQSVVQRVLAGEVQAYEELVRKYQTPVRRYCLGVLGNRADADDAAQEVFLKAFRGLKSFRGDASFVTWLFRIATNHCRDVMRKSGRQREQSWEALLESEGEQLEELLATPPDVDLSPERVETVRRVLACLPEPYRTVLVLREIEGLSYQELAQALVCSLDAVKSRLRRARRELAERVRPLVDR